MVNCSWDVGETNPQNCSIKHIHLYTTDLGYCFTIEPPKGIEADHLHDLNVILYIDRESFTTKMPPLSSLNSTSLVVGAKLMVHEKGTLPDLESGVVLNAGYENNVKLQIIHTDKLGAPYSRPECWTSYEEKGFPLLENILKNVDNTSKCDNQTYSTYSYNCNHNISHQESDKLNFRYFAPTCSDLNRQSETLKNCSCLSGQILSYFELREGYPLCYDTREEQNNLH